MATSTIIELAVALLFLPQGPQTYSIRGSVSAESGFTPDGIIVRLETISPSSPRPIEQVYTDLSGSFSFGDIPPGTYYVRVKEEGFEESERRVEVPGYEKDVLIVLERQSIPVPEILIGRRFQVDLRELSIPENSLHEYAKAMEERKHGKTESSIERFRRALRLAPTFVAAAFELASALYKIERFEEAENTLTQALAATPHDPRLQLMLANVFVKERK